MAEAKPRVLFLDDDLGKRYTIARQLRAAGFEVEEAETGAQALAMINASHDVAILDLRLPDLDGWEVCRRIKSSPETSQIMVLELSAACSTAQDRARGLDLGADAYLVHPVEHVELVATLNALIRLRRAVHERDLERELFVAMVGHDLRNPLSVIGQGLEAVRGSAGVGARERVVLDMATRNVGRMARMIDQILVFTKGLSGELTLDPRPVALAGLCQSVIDRIGAGQIRLVLAADPTVQGDPDTLGQVIENLVSNALKHGTGVPTVRLGQEPDSAVIDVHNDGNPIPAAAIPTLFEPYRRASSRPGGFGLGLFIVDRIARAHRGSVAVISTAERGTTFSIRLPLV